MTDINRQRFLAELGRLLTFMQEDDRLAALAMYNELFDESSDEQALLQLLSSPTRQAVLIARAYNAGSGAPPAEDADGRPGYAAVLDTIRAEALNRGVLSGEDRSADQISIFDAPEAAAEESAPESSHDAPPAGGESEKPAEAPEEKAESEKQEKPGVALRFDEEGNLVFEDVAEEPEIEEGAEPEEKPEDAAPAAEIGSAEEKPLGEAPAAPDLTPAADAFLAAAEPEAKSLVTEEPERRAIVWALIGYVILAVPLTLAGLMILLVPTFASLALSGLFGVVGVIAVSAAFGGGFAVFANVLVVLGVALMLLALSLLFLWLFIWFIVSVMVSLVGGVIALGRKWCYKEVQAE